ncbi:MAG: VCBS domain-containing protein, partial [Pirellulaceae bacterium]|nr:VCBS domain-containing protein [Pirellulaceae bacterium]
GDDLIVEFSTNSGIAWTQIDRQSGNGPDMTAFLRRTINLPASAISNNFQLRFRSIGTSDPVSIFDDWFVDDVSLIKTESSEQLLAAVARTLGLPVTTNSITGAPLIHEPLTASQFGSIINFKGDNLGLTRLLGIDYLVNARSIDLTNNSLDDLDISRIIPTRTPTNELLGSPALQSLRLAGNPAIRSVSQLAGLTQLQKLDLERTGIDANSASSTTVFASLNQLKSLQVNSTLLTPGTNVLLTESQPALMPIAHRSVDFNGVSGVALVGDAVSLGLQGDFTASAWIKADSLSSGATEDDPIFSSGDATASNGWHLTVRGGRAFATILGVQLTGTTVLQPGQWYHLTWRLAGSTLSLFVNGILDASRTGVSAFNGTGGVNLAAWPAGNRFFDGQLDNVRIWNRALTSRDVIANMNGTLSQDANLMGDWRFVEGSGTALQDFGPNQFTGQLIGTTGWVDSPTEITTSLRFDAVNDFVTLGEANPITSLTSNFTVAAWVKTDTFSSFRSILSGNNWGFRQVNGNLIFSTFGVHDYVTSAPVLPLGIWAHVAMVMKPDFSVDFYVNGQFIQNNPFNAPAQNFGGEVRIGARVQGQELWQGQLSQVGVWNTALDANQINQIRTGFLSGVVGNQVGFWPLNEGTGTTVSSTGPTNITGTLVNDPTWSVHTPSPWTVTGAVNVSGSSSPIRFTPTDDGLATASSRGDSFPIIIRNAAPDLIQIPDLGSTITEGQSIRLGTTQVLNAGLDEFWYDGNFGDADIIPLDPVANPSSLIGKTPIFRSSLNQALSYDSNAIFSRVGSLMDLDGFASMWSGRVTIGAIGSGAPLVAGNVTFGTASDDGSAIYIDLNNDGVFSNSELIVDNRGVHGVINAVGTANLAAGTYGIAVVFSELGGGEFMEARFAQGTVAAANYSTMTIINPAAAAQSGMWTRAGSVRIEVPVLVGSGTAFTPRDPIVVTEAGLADAQSVDATVSVIAEDGTVSDLSGRARRFADDALILPADTLDGLSNMTLAFWVKTGKPDLQTVISAQSEQVGNRFEVQISSTQILITDQITTNVVTFNVPAAVPNLANNQYHHLTIVRNRVTGQYRVIVNGLSAIAAGSVSIPVEQGRLSVVGAGVVVGQRVNSDGSFESGREFVGLLDELAVWDRALTNTEILSVFSGRISPTDTSLRMWLPLNEVTGNVAQDRSSAARDGNFVTSYAASLLAGRPVLYYPLNDTGTFIADATGNSRHGTRSGDAGGGAISVNSNLGTALDMTSASVAVPAVGRLPQWTMETWIRPEQFETNPVLYGTDSTAAESLQISFVFPGTLRVAIGGAATRDFGTLADFPINTYTHLVVTYNSVTGTLAVFTNGRMLDSQVGAPVVANLTAGRIGSLAGTSRFYRGRVDDFAIYNRVLSSLEVTNRFAARLTNANVPRPVADIASATAGDFRAIDNGNYTLRVQVADKDGGVSTLEKAFTVQNVAPVINDLNAVGPIGASTSSPISFGKYQFDAGDVTDAGSRDTFTYLWSVVTNNGQRILSSEGFRYEFAPETSGRFVLRLTVTDNDGASTTFSQTIVVNPIAVVDVSPDPTAGSIVDLSAGSSSPLAQAGDLQGSGRSVTRVYQWTVRQGTTTVATSTAENFAFVPLVPGAYSAQLVIRDRFFTGTTQSAELSSNVTTRHFTVSAAAGVTINVPSTPLAEGGEFIFTLSNLPPIHGLGVRSVAWTVTGGSTTITPTTDNQEYRVRFNNNLAGNGAFTIRATITDTITSPDGSFAPGVFVRIATPATLVVNNLAPTVFADDRTTREGQSVTLTALFTDAGVGDTHDFEIDWGNGQTSKGKASAGKVQASQLYPQDGQYSGTVTVTDNEGAGRTVAFTINVTNVAPVAVNDTGLIANEDTILAITAASLRANDTDVGTQDVLSIVSVNPTSTRGAKVSLSGSSIDYDPTEVSVLNALRVGQSLSDTFTYVLSDDAGARSTATVTITVQGRNDRPQVVPINNLISEDAVSVAGSLLSGALDTDSGTTLTVLNVAGANTNPSLGRFGSLNWAANGTYTYALNNALAAVQQLSAGQTLTETFAFNVHDAVESTLNTLTITIQGTNDGPQASSRSFSVAAGSSLSAVSGQIDDVILANSPVAYFRLGELDGTVAANRLAPVSRDGVIVGNVQLAQPSLVPNSPDYAMSFAGTEYVSIASNSLIDAYAGEAAAKSIALWFRATDTSTRQMIFEQ